MRRSDLLIILILAVSLAAFVGCSTVCQEDLINCRGRCKTYIACKERGCKNSRELAYIEDCRSLGVAHADGIGWRQSDEKAAEYYKIACDGGDGLGCTYLGLMYEDGRGVQANKAKALDLFKRGCTDKVTIACLGVERLEN